MAASTSSLSDEVKRLTDEVKRLAEVHPKSFSISRFGPLNRQLQLYEEATQRPSSAMAIYRDPNFNSIYEVERSGRNVPPTRTDNSAPSTTALRNRDFHLAWSGVRPPPGAQDSPAAPAESLSGPQSMAILQSMHSILEEYWEDDPSRRTIDIRRQEQLDADHSIYVNNATKEEEVQCLLKQGPIALANKLLVECHHAVQRKAEKDRHHAEPQAKQRTYPVPLNAPLQIDQEFNSYIRLPPTPAPGSEEDTFTSSPDLVIRHNGKLLATIELKPHLNPAQARELTTPQLAPLDPAAAPVAALTEQMRSLSVPGAPGTAAPRAFRPSDVQDGYLVNHWTHRMKIQGITQAYGHDCPIGAYYGDWGRLLVVFELLRLEEPGGKEDFALSFAPEAIFSFGPCPCNIDTDPDPVRHVDMLNAQASATPADQRLNFVAQPGMINALVHLALRSFHLVERLGMRPRTPALRGVLERPSDLSDSGKASKQPDGAGASRQNRPQGGGKKSSSRKGGGKNPRGSPRTQRGSQAGGSSSSNLEGHATSWHQVEQMAAIPLPMAFGTYANVHRACDLSAVADPKSEYTLEEIHRAKTVLKVHRRRLAHSSADRGPPPLAYHEEPAGRHERDEWRSDVSDIQRRVDWEMETYGKLRPLQGRHVPRLCGVAGPAFLPRSHGPKLLLERVGIPLYGLADEAPELYLEWEQEVRSAALGAVDACHSLGIVHNDLHGCNLMIEWVRTPERPSSDGASESGRHILNTAAHGHVHVADAHKGPTDAFAGDSLTALSLQVHKAHRLDERRVPASLVADIEQHDRTAAASSSGRGGRSLGRVSSDGSSFEPGSSTSSDGTEPFPGHNGLQVVHGQGLQVRIALADWAEASHDASPADKRYEVVQVTELLDQLQRFATERLEDSPRGYYFKGSP